MKYPISNTNKYKKISNMIMIWYIVPLQSFHTFFASRLIPNTNEDIISNPDADPAQ